MALLFRPPAIAGTELAHKTVVKMNVVTVFIVYIPWVWGMRPRAHYK